MHFSLEPLPSVGSTAVLHRHGGGGPKIGVPYFGLLIMRILLFMVLYSGPLFSETRQVDSHTLMLQGYDILLRALRAVWPLARWAFSTTLSSLESNSDLSFSGRIRLGCSVWAFCG